MASRRDVSNEKPTGKGVAAPKSPPHMDDLDKAASAPPTPAPVAGDPRRSLPASAPNTGAPDARWMESARRIYWQNVVREMLTILSMMREAKPDLFDGRMAILTHAGERIPIAEVFPMYACSLTGSAVERETSATVACTVFRVRTPTGELFTLPLEEIRALHALTPELVEQLENESMSQLDAREARDDRPFGFAAFTSGAAPGDQPASEPSRMKPGHPAPAHPPKPPADTGEE